MMKCIASFQLTTSMNYNRFNFPQLSSTRRYRMSHNNLFGGYAERTIYNPIAIALDATNGENEELDSRSSRRRRRKRDPIIDSIRKDENVPLSFVESLTTFLLRPISLRTGENTIIVLSLAYIGSLVLSVLVLPFTTWILLVLFNGVYVTLGNTIIEDDKKDHYVDNEDTNNGIIPLAAFTGALASAALLSPNGLVSDINASILSPVAIVTLFLAGLAVFVGVRDTADDEIRWRENDFREDRIREERYRMNLWDDEIDKTENDS
eukprot:scaffold138713_cov53-Cyclotella_meneghiniana.AAC.1